MNYFKEKRLTDNFTGTYNHQVGRVIIKSSCANHKRRSNSHFLIISSVLYMFYFTIKYETIFFFLKSKLTHTEKQRKTMYTLRSSSLFPEYAINLLIIFIRLGVQTGVRSTSW